MTQNIINHICFVLDASSSMHGKVAQQLIKVADSQIDHLAKRSQDLNQETRVTVYSFAAMGFTGQRGRSDLTKCLIWDMDVLRVPSIAELYKPHGSTPMIDGTMLALDDLSEVPEKYGEHSFLVYVLTDGQENASTARPNDLAARIGGLPDHWTVAAFVPDLKGLTAAESYGFPGANISVWDTTAQGLVEVGRVIRETTETFMQNRKIGVRGSRELFALKDPSLAGLKQQLIQLAPNQYSVFKINDKGRIDQWVNFWTGREYVRGTAYYEHSKRETIQPQKQIAIKSYDGKVFVGDQARTLLGLPAANVKVDPNHNPDYKIFVQSTSDNRNLMPNTELLLIGL